MTVFPDDEPAALEHVAALPDAVDHRCVVAQRESVPAAAVGALGAGRVDRRGQPLSRSSCRERLRDADRRPDRGARRTGGDRRGRDRRRRAGAARRHQSGRHDRDDVADIRRVSDLRADGPAALGDRAAGRARPPRPGRAWPTPRRPRASSCCAGRTIRPAPSSPRPTSSGSCCRVPSDTVVLLDEAYVEFVAPEHRIDAPALVRRYPNVVVLRTFSKAYGLAGLRIGYGFCAPDLARSLVDDAAAVRHRRSPALVAVAASYDAESRTAATYPDDHALSGRYLQPRLRSMGVYSTDATRTSCTCPRVRGRLARGVRRDRVCGSATTPTAECGSPSASRASTRAVLAAVAYRR